MAKAVIILGAGASFDFGVPILRGVFKDRAARRYLESNRWLADQLRDVFWEKRGVDLETSDRSLTIEEMLTLLRDCERVEGLPAAVLGVEDIDRLRRDLYVLVYSSVFKGKSSAPSFLNPLISIAQRKFEQITWASFNWDCIFESSFYYASAAPGPYSGRFNPRLVIDLVGWRQGPGKNKFLKLHGGVNWWMKDDQLSYLSWGRGGPLEAEWDSYAATAMPPKNYPLILEPSGYKYDDDAVFPQLECQWNAFREDLLDADCVLIIGYSMPALDARARSTIVTSFELGGARWAVVDPSDGVRDAYQRLLGNRRLKLFDATLVSFSTALEANVQEAFPMLA